MTWMLLNIPLMVVFIALWVGIPVWLVLKRPDAKPTLAAAPAIQSLATYRKTTEGDYRRVA